MAYAILGITFFLLYFSVLYCISVFPILFTPLFVESAWSIMSCYYVTHFYCDQFTVLRNTFSFLLLIIVYLNDEILYLTCLANGEY